MTNRMLFAAGWMMLISGSLAMSADAADWPAWRGPLARGSVEQGNYPVKFGADHYRWRSELPGKGCSTPIVLGGAIYLTAPAGGNDALVSYDLAGAERWRSVFGKENPGKHRNGSGSNASPATDGQAVFVFFKSGAFAAVELDGKVRWQTDLVERFGKDTLFWDHGTSPVVTSKYVVMARMHHGESWLAAFDKQTGELAWNLLSATSDLNFRQISAGRGDWAAAACWRRLLRRCVAGQVSSSTGARRKKLLRRELLT